MENFVSHVKDLAFNQGELETTGRRFCTEK